jgi:hypothetical protein
MAFKINTADQRRLGAAFDELTAQRSKLEDDVRAFNEAIGTARAVLQSSVETFNEKVQTARGLIDDLHREREDEFNGKSEHWQNSDKGVDTKEWIDSIDTLAQELTDATLDAFPETLEFEDVIGDDPADDYNELVTAWRGT